jgi:hypothetical protein
MAHRISAHTSFSAAFWTLGTRGQPLLQHGGKDGAPFPVDRMTYDRTIQTLRDVIDEVKLEKKDKYNAIKRL